MSYKSEYVDDKSIPDTEELWRIIFPNKSGSVWRVFSEKEQRWRPTSVAFQTSKKDRGISVFLKSILDKFQCKPDDLALNNESLVSLMTKNIRELNLGIYQAPLPGKPAHANIFDKLHDRTKSQFKKVQETLAKQSTWVIPPPESQK